MSITKIEEINEQFKLPIYFNSDKVELKQNITNDLELISTQDSSCNPIYNFCFNNDNDVSKKINEQISTYYTTDKQFLKDNQTLLKSYKPIEQKYTTYSPNYKKIIDIWNELKIDSGFKEKYYYVDIEMLEFLNRSEWFLQFLSLYNLSAPLISLLIPIIILIVPFVILQIKGISITINEYISVLKQIAYNNAIGKLFVVNFSEIDMQEKMYICVSAFFYLFSIYQNFMVFVRFNNNMVTIHSHFKELKCYLNHTLSSMKNYLAFSNSLQTHARFNSILEEKIKFIESILLRLDAISDYTLFNVGKIKEIGNLLKYFYELHNDKVYDELILYSIGFNGYIDCIEGLQQNIGEKKMNFAEFITSNKKNIMKNNYYACLKDSEPIKNTVKLDKNMIITGPNASGKTTILKSTLINIILSQQFGCGFYDSAKINPYKHLHCYLNIPDTSGRDSLFQAEARRCKEILDKINESCDDNHFCAFDELYSGTNPEEAEKSATAFMKYITKNKNVSCILTTHFIKVCKKLEKNKNVANCKMQTIVENGTLKYKYKLEEGISNVKGGIHVLKDLNYPKEIIDNTE